MAKAKHHRVGAAKPSVAISVGLAVAPLSVLFGYGAYSGAVWNVSGNKVQEALDRVAITYVGIKPSDGSTFGMKQGGGIGTAALIIGVIAHGLANWSGLNRYLARTKMPFRL